jgi:hypothetical protein
MARATFGRINNWQEHRPEGGGVFPGEVCSPFKGLAIRDVLNTQGKGFKTEFNLETMTYQFYSVCNAGILRKFVGNQMEFVFPVSACRICFGWITVKEYADAPVVPWLQNCFTCSGRKPPKTRHVLRLAEAHLVGEDDGFPIYWPQAWIRLGCKPPTLYGGRIYEADVRQARALAGYLSSKKSRTGEYLRATLALKRELKKKHVALLQDLDYRRGHILHLKGLAEETDYFDGI